jgi:hypothetical protein
MGPGYASFSLLQDTGAHIAIPEEIFLNPSVLALSSNPRVAVRAENKRLLKVKRERSDFFLSPGTC